MIKNFLQKYCDFSRPLLLALSGGTDSLALFYLLLSFRKQQKIDFHIAHVDHNWRVESANEAKQLKFLAETHAIPFHLLTLNFNQLKGNLEEACRIERLKFFSELCQQFGFQGVLLGHQQEDQVETILKKLFEGSHWFYLSGLQEETVIDNLRLLRPLLNISKQSLKKYLKEQQIQAFEDSSNQDEKYLRARMRHTIIPGLNQSFGKNISSSLIKLSEDMLQLDHYFAKKINPVMSQLIEGPFGLYVDLSNHFSEAIEINYFLRQFCKKFMIKLSREQYQQCTTALFEGKANQIVENAGKKLYVDRKHLFLLNEKKGKENKWIYEIEKKDYTHIAKNSSWKEGWKGECRIVVPKGDYDIVAPSSCLSQVLNKWWSKCRIPVCVRSFFPIICQNSEIIHECLTGKSFLLKKKEEENIEIIVRYHEL